MKNLVKYSFAALGFAAGLSASAAELLSRAEWSMIRSGGTLLNMPSLQRVVAKLDRTENGHVIIRHPGGDRGNIWAKDLRDWLIALGVGSESIVLEPGSGIPDTVVLDVERRGER